MLWSACCASVQRRAVNSNHFLHLDMREKIRVLYFVPVQLFLFLRLLVLILFF